MSNAQCAKGKDALKKSNSEIILIDLDSRPAGGFKTLGNFQFVCEIVSPFEAVLFITGPNRGMEREAPQMNISWCAVKTFSSKIWPDKNWWQGHHWNYIKQVVVVPELFVWISDGSEQENLFVYFYFFRPIVFHWIFRLGHINYIQRSTMKCIEYKEFLRAIESTTFINAAISEVCSITITLKISNFSFLSTSFVMLHCQCLNVLSGRRFKMNRFFL